MSEANHTPGPWTVSGLGGPWEATLRVRAKNWGMVAQIGVNPGMPHWDAPQRANARLIAAAPELLEVAKDFQEALRELGLFCECGESDCRTTRLRAAIAKATGQPHE